MKISVAFFIIFVLVAGCKEKYNPPVTSPQTGYLVVEGFINNGPEPTTITLSHTTPLEENASVVYETNAQVNIEGDNGELYPLRESDAGVYSSGSLTLNVAAGYRLHIITADNKEYISDYTSVKTVPPIDSINWQRDIGDLQIYINSSDPLNVTKYYQWQYVETWEYHSAFINTLKYIRDPVTYAITGLDYWDPVYHNYNAAIFTCWHTVPSTSILIGTTEKLTTGLIHQPIVRIPQGDQKLSVLYHIRLKQIAVSSAKYQFLQRMKRNTETLGSIFDAQPSQLNTNIHCLSDPAEQVIGFVEVSKEEERTVFIKNSDVPGWGYSAGCSQAKILNNVDTINSKAASLYPTTVATLQNNFIYEFYASDPTCVDCTLTGSNIKPSFWP